MVSQDQGMRAHRDHLGFRTTCGREVAVGWLVLGGSDHPARRVSLDISQSPGREDGTWAALTPAEARLLAADLLRQAAAAEGAAAAGHWRGRLPVQDDGGAGCPVPGTRSVR